MTGLSKESVMDSVMDAKGIWLAAMLSVLGTGIVLLVALTV
jgi:hypothetical protein